MLAGYAVKVEESRGRRIPEPRHPYRNDFQRDRDRVIHARAFRRLEDKTQVFTGRFSDHFRNRLTHTIEVQQISRTIAAALELNVDLTEALALVHDIGHPPFGHAGEKALDAAMRKHGESFDHNLHALRIVEDFEIRYIGFRGLNLTFEVREGIIKHSHDYSESRHPELKEYLLDCRPPLEAQLIDLTDEIAYTAADMDDGFESRILDIEHLRQIPLFEQFYCDVDAQHPAARRKLKFNETLRRIYERLVTDLIENTRRRIAEAGVQTLEQVRNWPERLASFSAEVDHERAEAKKFLYKHLYFSDALQAEKIDAELIVGGLFGHFMAHPESLPPAYQDKAAVDSLPRVVCDYIAGMTDNFIQRNYERLLDTDAPPQEL